MWEKRQPNSQTYKITTKANKKILRHRVCLSSFSSSTANITNFCRLATSRLADIFGNGTIDKHDKKFKRAKTPEIKRINRAPKEEISKSCEGLCESL